ncbi:MAG: DUF87 domain-containing protein [Blautia sp.]|jgi:conjugal transfer ATP-binding protein TraC
MANEVKELEKQLQEARKREKEAHRQEKKEQKEAKRNVRRREKEELKSRKQQLLEEKEIRREILQEETGGKPDKSKKKKKRREEEPIQKEEHDFLPYTWASLYLPIRKIKNGIIYTADRRYVKIVEILPINFLLRSPAEQRNIISSFLSYLKIAPVRMQFKVISRKADIAEYLKKIQREMEQEEDEQCRILQEDYMRLIRTVGTKEAITRRFFLIFEYSSYNRNKNPTDQEVYLYMKTAVQTARKYLSMCGNAVLTHENETRFSVDILYQMLNRRTSVLKPLSDKIQEVKQWYMRENGEDSLSLIPVAELIAPREIDFRHRNYIVMDGVYHTYLFIPSGKYRSKVPAGWMALMINAGEGIDVDLFIYRQDKSKSMERIGRRIRLNRSKIKDTYDTNSDYDDLSESIRAGYYLKNGLSGSEEFYYIAILITVTGNSAKEVEWRAKEMNKLLNSQDISTIPCTFREEEAFLSSLPLLALDKNIYQRAKRNALTSGVAACYPFTSYEMSDKDGIMMGVNKANSSLVIVDIFNSEAYKNANIAIMGTSGAGKTFTMQLMALRMRRKNIQVFIIAPDKGHEFARASQNIGGEFIQISPGSKNCINVMEIRPADNSANDILDGRTGERSELAIKIQSLHIFFSLLIPDMSYEEKQLLDEALLITYREKGITHDNESLWDKKRPGQYKKMPILGDLYEVMMRKPDTKRMANILNRLVHGSASSFNQETNVDLSNKYVVIDISELSGDLLLGMFVALDFVWAKAKEDRTKEKAIFIDEVWKLLSTNEMAASYVLEIFKVIRGYGGSAVCATQDLVDFFSLKEGKFGKGILSNSKTKIILNLESREAERIREELDLSEAEMMAVQKFERGNGLIAMNNNNLLVEFKASQLEKDLITTDRKDLQELKERLKRYGTGAYGRKCTEE